MAQVESPNQERFWDREAPTARFSHPLQTEWLDRVTTADSAILDYGCGYGRTIAELEEMGYRNLTGLDVSQGMLDRARAAGLATRFIRSSGPPATLDDESFDLVLLFAVLTSIPEDDDQRLLINDVYRLLRPEGHLYVSDLPLQDDPRRVARYQDARPAGLRYGTFALEGGRAVMRHHDASWFDDLFSGFTEIARETLTVATMRGRDAEAVQFLLQRPAP